MTDPPGTIPGREGEDLTLNDGGRRAIVMLKMAQAMETLARWRADGKDEAVYEVLGELSRDELVAVAAAATQRLGWQYESALGSPTTDPPAA